MLHDKLMLWIAFALVSLGTFLPRSSFIVAGKRAQLPRALQRALKYAPASAISGLIIQDILVTHNQLAIFTPKLFASVIAIATILLSRSPWLPFITGMIAIIVAGYF